MRGFLALLLALALFGAGDAQAGKIRLWHHGGGAPSPPPSGCPNPVTLGDGCSTHVTGALIQQANFFSGYANRSGQVYFSTNPNATWNQPWINTPIGPYSARASAVDPNLAGNRPAGCSSTQTGTPPNDYMFIDCSSPAAFNWKPMELGPINGHGPTFIQFHPSTTTQQNFDNWWFTEPSSCVASPTGAVISVQNGTTANFSFTNFDLDGNGQVCNYIHGLNGITVFTTGNSTVMNGYFKNINGRGFSVIGSMTSFITIYGNAFDGFAFNNGAHGEFGTIGTTDGGPLGSLVVRYNTALLPPESCACSTTTFYMSNGVSGNLGNIVFDHNVAVGNMVGGVGAHNGAANAHIDDGAGGPGNIMTFDSAPTGTLAPGSFIAMTGAGVNLMVNLTPGNTGSGSKWTVSCQQAASSQCPGGFVNAGPVDVPNFVLSSRAATIDNRTVSATCMEMAHNSYGSVTVTNTLCDNTGGAAHFFALSTPVCATPTFFSGNLELVGGGAIDRWDARSGTTC